VGWDARSLILMVLQSGSWHAFRLPKVSHAYDGAHGWNTEWPRIRAVGDGDLLMTMHGAFWRFPRGFSATEATGIRPRFTDRLASRGLALPAALFEPQRLAV
jgi:hypothetical protein